MRVAAVLSVLIAAALGCSSPAPTASAPKAPAALPAGSEHSSGAADADPVFVDDFTRLRTQYGDKEDFGALCEDEHPLLAMVETVDGERWQAALDIALPWLAHCPVDIDARMVAAVALAQLARPSEAVEQTRWYRGLVDSILASGDGKSMETAFVVISVPEEYSVLRALGLAFRGQALVGNGIDAMSVEGESGRSTLYFNPEAHFRRLARQLGD